MKQVKFLMVALALLMGMSLTSCLGSSDSTSESSYDGLGYLRVKYGTYFEDLNGVIYVPTAASVTSVGLNMSSADLVYVAFKFVDSTTSSSSSYDVQLVAAAALTQGNFVTTTTAYLESVTENAPIQTLNPTTTSGTVSPWLYGDEMLVLPISWLAGGSPSAHTMSLVYLTDDADETDTRMVFYLRHDIGSDSSLDTSTADYRTYDIESVLTNYKAKHGAYPNQIVIKAKVSSSDATTLPSDYTSYTISDIDWD